MICDLLNLFNFSNSEHSFINDSCGIKISTHWSKSSSTTELILHQIISFVYCSYILSTHPGLLGGVCGQWNTLRLMRKYYHPRTNLSQSICTNIEWVRDFFSGKRDAETHMKGNDKHMESFATVSLYKMTAYLHII